MFKLLLWYTCITVAIKVVVVVVVVIVIFCTVHIFPIVVLYLCHIVNMLWSLLAEDNNKVSNISITNNYNSFKICEQINSICNCKLLEISFNTIRVNDFVN